MKKIVIAIGMMFIIVGMVVFAADGGEKTKDIKTDKYKDGQRASLWELGQYSSYRWDSAKSRWQRYDDYGKPIKGAYRSDEEYQTQYNQNMKPDDFWGSFTTNFKDILTDYDAVTRESEGFRWEGITSVLRSTSYATSGISRLFYDYSDPTWSDENDGALATMLGGMERWKAELCSAKAQNLDASSNQASVVIGSSGTSYAHIEGERTTVVTNNNTEYLYVITYGINAYECDMTADVYLGDDKIDGTFRLQAPDFSPSADPTTEQKKNTSKSGRYVNYSTDVFSEACIIFDEKPWCLIGLETNKLCNEVTEASENPEPGFGGNFFG